MLIRSVRSQKSQIEHELNELHSAAGQAKLAEGEQIQADVQGSLSDLVREHEALTDDQIADWEDSLSDRYSSTVVSRKNAYNRRTYKAVDGKWVPTFDTEELPELPKPKCFRPLFGENDAT